MNLIASGAYLQGEFVSEVGLLPPSFLPIGNKRLYEYQIEFLASNMNKENDVYLSIPESYALDEYDTHRLQQLSVTLLKVPDGLSLGESILYCWNAAGKHYDSLTLLHGDTLFLDAVFGNENAISMHANRGFYQRATLGQDAPSLDLVHNEWSSDCDQVISGYFNFTQPLHFMKSLIQSKNDFIAGIVNYHKSFPIALVNQGEWLDFGHINSFFNSRTLMTTQRVFNDLKITQRKVYKSSQKNPKKIFAEGNWFDQLPRALKLHTPALLALEAGAANHENAHYEIEYLYLLPLSDLFVFSRLANGCWQAIFNGIAEVLKGFTAYRPNQVSAKELQQIDSLYLPKTMQRLQSYAAESNFDIYAQRYTLTNGHQVSLVEIAQQSQQYIQPAKPQDIAVSHGDLCFSNMLFDSRVQAIKCIDPRGVSLSGEFSIFGDRRYDLAKLYHSVIGLYDFIIAGRFELQNANNTLNISLNSALQAEIENSFQQIILETSSYSEKEILAITIHLFLSMLPLHSDKPARQKAFIANAVRLFEKLLKVQE